MDLDNKSKFVEMHQMTALRQMLEFAKETLGQEIAIILNADFSGKFEGAMGNRFDHIGEAVEHAKEFVKKHVAQTINQYNNNLKESIERTKKLSDDREEWRKLGEEVLAGKYTIPEEAMPMMLSPTWDDMARSEFLQYSKVTTDQMRARQILWADQKALSSAYDQGKKAINASMYGGKSMKGAFGSAYLRESRTKRK